MADTRHVVCAECHRINRVASDRLRQGPVCGSCRAPLFNGRPTVLDERSFGRYIERNDLPVVVDFWAPWCGPCRMMAPAYEQAAARLAPHVLLAKVDTEAAPALGARYGIQAIPTLVAFARGREIARQPGAMDLPRLVEWIRASTRLAGG